MWVRTVLIDNFHKVELDTHCVTGNISQLKQNTNQLHLTYFQPRVTNYFQDRICEHRDYAKSDNVEQPAGNHFTANGHSVAHLKGCCLEKVKNRDKFVLRERERLYIQKFDTFRNGLNQES